MPSFLAKFADTDAETVTLLKECAWVLYGFDPQGVVARDRIAPGLRAQIRTAAPPDGGLAGVLAGKRNASFLRAKAAGYVFDAQGRINTADPWVQAMIARRRPGTVPVRLRGG